MVRVGAADDDVRTKTDRSAALDGSWRRTRTVYRQFPALRHQPAGPRRRPPAGALHEGSWRARPAPGGDDALLVNLSHMHGAGDQRRRRVPQRAAQGGKAKLRWTTARQHHGHGCFEHSKTTRGPPRTAAGSGAHV
jgi:hypothetical protein